MSGLVSPGMAHLLDVTERFGFAVPSCRVCGRVHYPPQSWCPYCLSPEIDLLPDTGHAIVLSTIAVHRTLDVEWESHLPAHVVCVLTDSGIKLFAMADFDIPVGTPVILEFGAGLLQARAIE